MHVFLCGAELGIGFVVAQRLLAEGHKVTMLTGFEGLVPNLAKNNMNPILGDVQDAAVRQEIAKADAVIDVELPNTLLLQKVRVTRLRPYLLAQLLRNSGRSLIVTSSAAVLGDTGPVPAGENKRSHPLPGFAWLPRLENEIVQARGVRSIVIRPAWEVHGSRPPNSAIDIGNWIKLAKRFRRGKYIGLGENCYSAVHFDDLADLYRISLKGTVAGTILHAASENFSMKELAAAIHRGLGFKGEPSSLSLKEARRFTPIADRLIYSHALSGDLARTLGWRPSRDSILKEVEQRAFENTLVSRLKLPGTECRTK